MIFGECNYTSNKCDLDCSILHFIERVNNLIHVGTRRRQRHTAIDGYPVLERRKGKYFLGGDPEEGSREVELNGAPPTSRASPGSGK